MTELSVDINCDMGESYGAYQIGQDEEIFPWITSANVACGFHAGDPQVIEWTIATALRHSVAVGAHPGFPDLRGFGRRAMQLTPDEARTDVLYQIGALYGFVRAAGARLQHVKPHGQLNTMAVIDRRLADAIVAAVQSFDPSLLLISSGGELSRAAEAAGMPVAHEAYADREYLADGTLAPRSRPGAVIADLDRIVPRAVAMVKTGQIRAVDGGSLSMKIETVCVHGDTPGAPEIARALRSGLESSGIRVRPLWQTAGGSPPPQTTSSVP